MVYLSDGVKDSVRSLCYYPYTIGKHLDKINQTLSNIYLAFTHLPDSTYLIKRIIQNVGSIWYFTRNGNTYIERVSWSSVLTKFYYVKSNFITFTAHRNISSVHPSQYVVRDEPYFRCDNGFKVVSRNYRGKQLFNFIDISDGFARIVSDIDFIQVKPFSEYKDMTARGYTPDRRCYMVFQDGALEEMNENILMRKDKISLMEQNNNTTNKFRNMNNKKVIRLTESQLHNIIAESVEMILMEGKYVNNKPIDDYVDTKLGLPSLINNGDLGKVVKLLNSKEVRDMYKKHNERENNKIVDPLITRQTDRKARIDHQKYWARIRAENELNPIPSSYESDYFGDDAVDIIVNYDLLPKSIKPKNFVAGEDMSPEGEIVYGHLSPDEEVSIYRRLRKAGVPENAIATYNC